MSFLSFLIVQNSLPYKRMGRASALYAVILENFWTWFDLLKVLFRIPSISKNFASLCWISFSFSWEISQPSYLKNLYFCKHLLSTTILRLIGHYPKNAIICNFFMIFLLQNCLLCFVTWILPFVNYPLIRLLWPDLLQKAECFLYWLIK